MPVPTLSQHFADIICGPDKQDVACIIVSPKGYGKSYTAMEIAYQTAVEIAKRRGGTFNDYFPYDPVKNWLPNVGVIETQEILKVLKNLQHHQCAVLDDVGVGMNARKFASKENMLINDILEMMRIDNTLVILTVMDQAFVDKVPRSIVPYFIEIADKRHEAGINILKVFENKKLYRSGKLIHPYLTIGRNRIVRTIARSPPPFISHAYDHMRSVMTQKSKMERIEAYEKRDVKITSRDQKWIDLVDKWGEEVKRLTGAGLSPYQITQKIPIGPSQVEGILRRIGIA